MAQNDTFFQQRDKRRWVTDRVASSIIKLGGVSVLVALLLLIFYLIVVITPIFSPATMEPAGQYRLSDDALTSPIVALGVDDDGRTAFHFTQDGWLAFSALPTMKNASTSLNELLFKSKLVDDPVAFRAAETSSRWYGYSDQHGFIYAAQPKFSSVFTQNGRQAAPSFITFANNPIPLDPEGEAITQFDFSIQSHDATFVGVNQQGQWQALRYYKASQFGEQAVDSTWQSTRLTMPTFKQPVRDFILTPNGDTLYVLHPGSISVLKRHQQRFELRETVSLLSSEKSKAASSQGEKLTLLSGAYSVLVTQSDGVVSQWFDVLQNGERHFTRIRSFERSDDANAALILPDFYRKGFFRFDSSGRVDNYFTTADGPVLSQTLSQQAPLLAATSSNEKVLIAAYPKQWNVYHVDMAHPDISVKALWKKVWYEGYPEPEFIWQSTSASNDFEAKFSLVPIAFGTLKSALFAMLFAVPIAICGAIYTAYFMTPSMRRYVKPTVELMEALPTVIIGFLAGLWLAPIVELNLLNTILFLLLLPVVILLAAFMWHLTRRQFGAQYQGWVALFLIPVVVLFGWLISLYGHQFESWVFGGDVRFFLAQWGVDFDQRNALIVGFAMGFAVIPTIFTIAEDAIFSVPKHLSDGASALGATPWQCLTTVVLVTASPGIFSAVMMGLGRAVGETMIVLMATGNTPVMDWNIFEGMRTLSANIAIEMPESEVGSSHFRLLFLSAFLLFAFTFVVNSLAEFIRQRLRGKYSAL